MSGRKPLLDKKTKKKTIAKVLANRWVTATDLARDKKLNKA
jgi:hypothetical protein